MFVSLVRCKILLFAVRAFLSKTLGASRTSYTHFAPVGVDSSSITALSSKVHNINYVVRPHRPHQENISSRTDKSGAGLRFAVFTGALGGGLVLD